MGFRYFGPLDGHNLHLLIPALKNILNIKGPRLLHVVTKKGKGYAPAEKDPVRFHGVGSFDLKSGESNARIKMQKTYTEVFSHKLIELAATNNKILAITAAMPEGTGLDKFRDLYPERFFDVGIAEAHAVCFSAGLARQGFKPVVAIYSTFFQRAYDQVIEDVALQNLPVVFALDRAGIVGEDGATHQGLFDIAYLRSIPNLVIMAPSSEQEFNAMLEFAFKSDKPTALRYPRAICPAARAAISQIILGKAEELEKGKDFALIALGSMVVPALEAIRLLKIEGLTGTLINARFAKPLDSSLFKNISKEVKHIFTVEEGVLDGGFGSSVAEAIDKPVTRIGLPCEFIPHGKRELILEKYGLTSQGIADKIRSCLK